MRARPRIGIAQTQRLQLNLGLTHSIRLLGLDAVDLARYLEEQAALNPALKIAPPVDPAPGEWLPRWTAAFEGERAETLAAAAPSLMAHVTQEIRRLNLTDAQSDMALALAEALEPSGWIGQPLSAIAAAHRLDEGALAHTLRLLQTMEPTGLFAQSLADCLRLQARDQGNLDAVLEFMLNHLELVAAGDVERIAALCKVPLDDVLDRLRLLRRFDPKPGARFVQGAAPLREPDLIARRTDAGWEVILNRAAQPTLYIDDGGTDRAAVIQARALAQMVRGRSTMMLKVAHAILMRQRAALDHGAQFVVPMTMAEIADELSLHESTVSRAVAGSAVDTPIGTLWLRAMFTGRIGGQGGAAAAEVRAVLSQLVAAENPAAPLADADLVAMLAERGLHVARRTLSKYRAMLNIPPSNRRRRR